MKYALLLSKGPTIEIWGKGVKSNSSQTLVLYSFKSTFLTFSSQISTKSVNLTKFLPFPFMRNIEYLRGILSSHEKCHIPTMRNGKTTAILSSLLWDSHKIFIRVDTGSMIRPLIRKSRCFYREFWLARPTQHNATVEPTFGVVVSVVATFFSGRRRTDGQSAQLKMTDAQNGFLAGFSDGTL